MSRRAIAVAAVVFGVLAAVVITLAVPTRSAGQRPPAAAAHRSIVVLPELPQKATANTLVLVPLHGSVRIEARMRDPLGGPPFALRIFKAKRIVPLGPNADLGKHSRLLGHELCGQLGRIYHGRFGWLDARRRFRPARFGYFDAPIVCGDRWRDTSSMPQVQLTTLISDPSTGSANELEALAWGFGGSLVKQITLSGLPTRTPAPARYGAFLVSAPTSVRANELTARFDYRGRASQTRPFGFLVGTRNGSIRGRARVVAGTSEVEARAPDPGGGVPWGVLGYRTSNGKYCVTQPGRIVGNRVGTVNFVLGTFDDVWDAGRHCGASLDGLPASWPVGIGSIFGGGLTPQRDDPTSDPTSGRTALRTLPGDTVIYGVARPNVRQVTIESPRDVRTLIPSPRAHSFIVVYDGAFPAGQMKLTATMADGSKKTVRQIAGF